MRFRRCAALFLGVLLLSLFGDCGGVRNASAESAAPRKDLPSFHYLFAHNQLPRALYADPQLGLSLALSEDRKNMLLRLWEHWREQFPEFERNNAPVGLASEGGTITDDLAVAVITMPQPQSAPEAYYICVIVRFTVGDDGEAAPLDIGYYTLEKSIRLFAPDGNEQAGQSVPTVIGSWDKDHTHGNHGEGPAPGSLDDFLVAVLKLYLKKNR